MSKVKKSQLVREYLAQHPDASPTEVANALSEIGVAPAFVALLSANTPQRTKKEANDQPRRRKKRPKQAARSADGHPGQPYQPPRQFEAVILAARLIRLSGGIEEARIALQTAARAGLGR